MNNKCRYVTELENKMNDLIKGCKIIVVIFLVVCLLLIDISKLKFLFLDSNGNFSSEIFWSALGSIGSIIAFVGVIYTIKYTENSRRMQNEYEYQKQQLSEDQLKFKEQVMNILDEVNPAYVIEIITRVNEDNFWQINQELNKYRLVISNLNYKLYWYYNEKIKIQTNAQNTKLMQFADELNNIINNIEECINAYANELIPIYCDMKMYNNLSEIIRLRGELNENDQTTYVMIKSKYHNETISNVLLQKINSISIKVVEYRNKNWNNFIELAKDVVMERENIVEEILKTI